MSKYRYGVSVHVAQGVIVSYDTNELVDFANILENPNGTITVSGPTPKTQIIPVRNILAVEVIDNGEDK